MYSDGVDPRTYLEARTGDAPNELLTTEELLLLWVANRNPAFMRYDDLFDEQDLATSTDYPLVVAAIRKQAARDAEGASGVDLVARLLEPARQAPGSLAATAALDRDNWPDIVDDDLLARLTWSLDVLAEEQVAAERAWSAHAGGGGDTVESAALAGFGGQEEPESFSQDLDLDARPRAHGEEHLCLAGPTVANPWARHPDAGRDPGR